MKKILINFIPVLAIPAAIFLPSGGQIFTPYTSVILAVSLFFAFLGLRHKDFLDALKKPWEPLLVSFVVLILSPLVIYPIAERFFPLYFTAAILFMLMPSAISSPVVATLYGGNVPMATVNSVFSNLLSPITIPLFLTVFVGAAAKVSSLVILKQLAVMIFIPFALSFVVDRFWPRFIEASKHHYRFINIGLLFLLFYAVLAAQVESLREYMWNGGLWTAILVSHLVLLGFAKLLTLHEKDAAKKTSVEINLIFLNVGLGVILAQQYFGPQEVIFLVFCNIVWDLMLGLFKFFR